MPVMYRDRVLHTEGRSRADTQFEGPEWSPSTDQANGGRERRAPRPVTTFFGGARISEGRQEEEI